MPRSGTESLRRRGRLNALKRHRGNDDPATLAASRDLAAARALDYIRQAVQASRVAQGLPPVVVDAAALERAAAVLRCIGPQAHDRSGGSAA